MYVIKINQKQHTFCKLLGVKFENIFGAISNKSSKIVIKKDLQRIMLQC